MGPFRISPVWKGIFEKFSFFGTGEISPLGINKLELVSIGPMETGARNPQFLGPGVLFLVGPGGKKPRGVKRHLRQGSNWGKTPFSRKTEFSSQRKFSSKGKPPLFFSGAKGLFPEELISGNYMGVSGALKRFVPHNFNFGDEGIKRRGYPFIGRAGWPILGVGKGFFPFWGGGGKKKGGP